MNLPNKLTVFRMILIIPFVLALLWGEALWPQCKDWLALGIFLLASLTDAADGYIARKYQLITNFGKLMDPLADKLLVTAALLCLVELGRLPAWIAICIVSREFVISGFRQVAVEKGVVIAASAWGKLKTISQMAAVCLLLANIPALSLLTQAMVWISLALTLISLGDYLWKNRQALQED